MLKCLLAALLYAFSHLCEEKDYSGLPLLLSVLPLLGVSGKHVLLLRKNFSAKFMPLSFQVGVRGSGPSGSCLFLVEVSSQAVHLMRNISWVQPIWGV